MADVADLIRRSLQKMGVLADGESATASQQSDAFLALKAMLDSWRAEGLDAPSYTATTDEVDAPPGYERAMLYNLCLELADDYGYAPTQSVGSNAAEGKFLIKRTEHVPDYMECDPAVLQSGTFDLTNGDS